MKITDISKQKHKNRINVYVDGDFYAGISEETAANLGFYVGKEVEKSDLSKLSGIDDYYKALSRSFNYLSIRKHSVYELKTKLNKYYDYVQIENVIKRLLELKYLDDQDFAENFVRFKKGSCGIYKMELELKKRGISKEIISSVLTSVDKDQLLEAATILLHKKDKLELDINKRRQRMLRFLASRGFDYSIINKAITENIKE